MGELQNIVKKHWRGDSIEIGRHFAEELADIRVYLELITRICGYQTESLVKRYALPKIRERWPKDEEGE